jgi:hypothetical protein
MRKDMKNTEVLATKQMMALVGGQDWLNSLPANRLQGVYGEADDLHSLIAYYQQLK